MRIKKRKTAHCGCTALQLFVNFFWPILFFRLELYTISFVWLLFLWLLILVTFARFWRISMPAAWLLVPYLVWVTFAGYLNLGVALLNSIPGKKMVFSLQKRRKAPAFSPRGKDFPEMPEFSIDFTCVFRDSVI